MITTGRENSGEFGRIRCLKTDRVRLLANRPEVRDRSRALEVERVSRSRLVRIFKFEFSGISDVYTILTIRARLGEMLIHEPNTCVNVLLHFLGEQTTVKYT